jgi:hypothetical protein
VAFMFFARGGGGGVATRCCMHAKHLYVGTKPTATKYKAALTQPITHNLKGVMLVQHVQSPAQVAVRATDRQMAADGSPSLPSQPQQRASAYKPHPHCFTSDSCGQWNAWRLSCCRIQAARQCLHQARQEEGGGGGLGARSGRRGLVSTSSLPHADRASEPPANRHSSPCCSRTPGTPAAAAHLRLGAFLSLPCARPLLQQSWLPLGRAGTRGTC